MANIAQVENDTATGNDYAEHESTYRGFLTFVKWATGSIAAVLILMAIFLT